VIHRFDAIAVQLSACRAALPQAAILPRKGVAQAEKWAVSAAKLAGNPELSVFLYFAKVLF